MEPAAIFGTPDRIRTRADFEEMFKSHYSPLCSYANQFLKDIDTAEEVVQEVMFKIWTGRDSIVIGKSLKSYLFMSVRNSCMNVFKHHKVREAYRQSVGKKGEPVTRSMEDEMIATELGNRILEAVDRLPLERRKVFIMSRYDGMTYAQIAGKLNISVKTVENQMGKALKTLREELKDYLPLMVVFLWMGV